MITAAVRVKLRTVHKLVTATVRADLQREKNLVKVTAIKLVLRISWIQTLAKVAALRPSVELDL